jgi:hydrogenase expression/formation protein HypD
MVYSTFDALQIAEENPSKNVVFLGVGFETTAPTVAAALVTARQRGLENFYVYSAHKLVPPALEALMSFPDIQVDGFLLPGHVSVIIGMVGYRPVLEKAGVPSVIAGFEPADILHAMHRLIVMTETGAPALENAYPRAVTEDGNPKARQLLAEVFETVDVTWRGIGPIAGSGLKIRESFGDMDAGRHFGLDIGDSPEPKGCACGEILTGTKIPPECALYKKRCTPIQPVGPCMVSSEGTCAAYYRYHDEG